MSKENVKSLKKNTIYLYLMTIGKYLLPLITLPYLTRVLSPHNYGIVTYLTATMTYFQVLVDFGYNFSATKEASLKREKKEELGKILTATISFKSILSFVSLVILVIISIFVPLLRENSLLTFLYFTSVVVTIFLPDYIYRGLEKMEIVSARFILSRLVSTILTFVLIRDSNDILLMPILLILGNFAAVLFSYYHLFFKEKIFFRKIDIHYCLCNIRKSSVFFVATMATTAFGATTTFVMGIAELAPSEIAFWGLAYQFITTIQMLYDPIVSSIYPYMIRERDFILVKKILKVTMPLIIFGVIFAFFTADYVIPFVCGDDYIGCCGVFKILLPILILSFPAQILGFPVMAPINKEKFVTKSTVISAVFHIIGLLLLLVLDCFSIINIAILRSITDIVLLLNRLYYLRIFSSAGLFKNTSDDL